MKKLRISSKLLCDYPRDDASEYVRQGLLYHKKMGFDAADFSMGIIRPLEDKWQPCIEKAIEYSEEIGMRFEVCHLPYSVAICTHPEELPPFIERMHRAIDAAAMLGVEYAVLHPNTTTLLEENFDRKKEFDNVMCHIAPFAEHANRVNVKLAVENMRLVHKDVPTHRYCQAPDELCEIADALGIDVCWDFGHGNTCGLIQSEAIKYIGKRLKVLHVNDNKGIGDDHLAPFAGTIDWQDAMNGLKDIGFDGLFNYESGPGNHNGAMRDSFVRYLVEGAHELLKL